MATFTNVARLYYQGQTIESNEVTGEILQALSASKTALSDTYEQNGTVTYVVGIVNSGTTARQGLTLTDDLGAYPFGTGLLYPLSYVEGTLRYFVNGELQPTPATVAGPPLVVSGIGVPAGGNALIVYETRVTEFAPLGTGVSVTNTVRVTGQGLDAPIVAEETVSADLRPNLTITKALDPTVVGQGEEITYTFTIRNFGAEAVVATDDVVLSDIFDPIIAISSVTFNGTPWTTPAQYTLDESTGLFLTVPGNITVPAATFVQRADGSFSVIAGESTLVVVGTVG